MTSKTVIRKAFETCLAAVEPRQIVRNKISLSPSSIKIGDAKFPLDTSTKIVLISLGKASILMAQGAQEILKAPLLQKTLILAPEQQRKEGSGEGVFFAAKNNLPDQNSLSATDNLIREIQKLDGPSTIFIFLISGGGSALLCSPKPPITLSQKLSVIRRLQSEGADIEQLNTIRQKLSAVKGGKLLRNIRKGGWVSLMISDVIGDKVDIIASGPTVIPKEGRKSVKRILEDLRIGEKDLEPKVWELLMEEEDRTENGNELVSPRNFIISGNKDALQSASEYLTSSGYRTHIISSTLSGNAAEIGGRFADLIASDRKDLKTSELLRTSSGIQNPFHFPLALVFGGETTVQLAANPGKGGRNQEMVLSCLQRLKSKNPRHQFTFLSAGTDGQDGPTDAAGAVISNSDLLLPSPTSSEFLANSDSYSFWKTFNNGKSHLLTGPSGTNVMDIQILLLDGPL